MIEEFKDYWAEYKGFIELVLTDKEIQKFIDRTSSIEIAVDRASDYILSQGLGEVQE